MKKFEIVYHPSESDIREMIKLDCESFSGLDVGEFDKCLKWQQACPEIYTAIKFGGRVIGYTNFVGITKECYEKIRAGKLKDYELNDGDIIPFRVGENYCLFMSIVVEKKFRYTDAVVELSNAFFERINKMKQKNIRLNNILCDCVSEDGEKLVKRFGAKFVSDSKDGTKIYEFGL